MFRLCPEILTEGLQDVCAYLPAIFGKAFVKKGMHDFDGFVSQLVCFDHALS